MKGKLQSLLAALIVLFVSFGARISLHDRTPEAQGDSWTVSDPDSLYHARRVERLLDEGLPVAGDDEFLNSPAGARIPWPPYYEIVVATLIGPSAPSERTARHDYIERNTARLPLIFGVLTSLFAFLAARSLLGNLAGTSAGLLHALSLGSIAYSCEGNGDHHAFISLCNAIILWGLSASLKPGRLERASVHWGIGALLGVICGLAIGSWVASLIMMLIIDGVFACLLLGNAKTPRKGLAAFGLSLHAAALITLLPAVLQSPWKDEFPWMVVNLSWFHLAYLGVGCFVFVPLIATREASAWRRFYPWLVGIALCCVALISLLLNAGPAAGIREGFEWVSRQDTFMGFVAESRALLGSSARSGEVFLLLGWQIILLPLAWIAALIACIRKEKIALLPWIVASLPMAAQAASQVRFAEALALPAAVLVAWGLVMFMRTYAKRLPRVASVLLLLAITSAGQFQTIKQISLANESHRPDWRKKRAARELCTWVANNSNSQNEGALLANWNRGHEIEWAAGRPSVATNFGSYVGEEGFLAPARFFLSETDQEAEALMSARDARFVMHSCFLSSALPGWIHAGDASWRGRYFLQDDAGKGSLLPAWFDSIGGRLLNTGQARARQGTAPSESIDFLRLVHVSPTIMRRSPLASWRGPVPYGWIWERVPGAQVQLTGRPDAQATIEIDLEFMDGKGARLELVKFRKSTQLDATGNATLRVPYATDHPRALRALWTIGDENGSLRISEEDVLSGRAISPSSPW
ncbi:MAG: asparagine N-glycosylation enzyme membrane subunit Stt3 [Planctomycetota bacterium]|jgi:asparagine N-glycosylation enzyme membrane subunit Stt3